MAVVAISNLLSPCILLILIKFVFCQVKIVPPVNPISCSPDNDLGCEEAEKDGEKTGNRKTGKHGCQFAEGESPKKDEVEERRCNPKTESVRIFLRREVLSSEHHVGYIQGVFFHWASPKKLKYGKPRLGESTLT